MNDYPYTIFIAVFLFVTMLFFWFNESALARLIQLLAVRLELMRIAKRAVERRRNRVEEYWRERVKTMPNDFNVEDCIAKLGESERKGDETDDKEVPDDVPNAEVWID